MTGMRGSKPETTLSVRVQPRASSNAVAGWAGGILKVRLTVPPVEGAANYACLALLADLLDLPPSRLTIFRGARSRNKVVRIIGLSQDEVHSRLNDSHPSLSG